MRDEAGFEALLGRSLARHAGRVDQPFDPAVVAHDVALLGTTPMGRAFEGLTPRVRLLVLAAVALAAVALAAAGARLLEPKPFGWGTTMYLLTDERPDGERAGGPFLVSAPVGTDAGPNVLVAIGEAGAGVPSEVTIESVSPSGRFAVLTTHNGLPHEEPGIRFVVDTVARSVERLGPSFAAIWAPGTDRLAWVAGDRYPSSTVYVLDAAAGPSRLVFAAAGGIGAPLWLGPDELVVDDWHEVVCTGSMLGCTEGPDGTPTRGEFTTWRVSIDGSPPVEVEEPGAIAGWRGSPTDVSVSPDRSLVGYFVEDLSGLEPPSFPRTTTITVWVHEPDGANGRVLASFTRPIDGPFRPAEFTQTVWSADSLTFSWAMAGQLWVASVDGLDVVSYDLPTAAAAKDGSAVSYTWRLP